MHLSTSERLIAKPKYNGAAHARWILDPGRRSSQYARRQQVSRFSQGEVYNTTVFPANGGKIQIH